jgi:hypothetical protein
MFALAWIVLAGASGVASTGDTADLVALALLVASGASITVSLLFCKRLHASSTFADKLVHRQQLSLGQAQAGCLCLPRRLSVSGRRLISVAGSDPAHCC